jgi:hypothetical protein
LIVHEAGVVSLSTVFDEFFLEDMETPPQMRKYMQNGEEEHKAEREGAMKRTVRTEVTKNLYMCLRSPSNLQNEGRSLDSR